MTKKMLLRILPYLLLVIIHFLYLVFSGFLDWPEMLLYPWLVHNNFNLYRDMLVMYQPLVIYLLQFVYGLIGFTPESMRMVSLGMFILTDCIFVFVLDRLWRQKSIIGLIVFTLYIVWHPVFEGNTLWFEQFYLPLLLAGYFLLHRFAEHEKPKYLILSGGFFGIAMIMKQQAIWPFLGTAIFLFLGFGKSAAQKLSQTAGFIVLPVLFSLFVLGFYALSGDAGEYLFWVYGFPLFAVSGAYGFTLHPSLAMVARVIPPYLAIIPAAYLVIDREVPLKVRKQIALAMILSLTLLASAWPRWGIFKQLASLPFVFVIWGYVFEFRNRFVRGSTLRRLFIFFIVFAVLSSSRSMYRYYTRDRFSLRPFFSRETVGVSLALKDRLQGQSLYIYGKYDYLYVLLDLVPEVRPWTQHFPWMLAVPGVQDRIISALETQKIQYVLLEYPVPSTGVTEYINRNYIPVSSVFPDAMLMRRYQANGQMVQ